MNKEEIQRDIIDNMIEEMPFELGDPVRPYIYEAMDIYARKFLKSQTIKTVNPHGYLNNAGDGETYLSFNFLQNHKNIDNLNLTPLYTMQLTEKVACEVCNDTEDLKTICSDCITNECNDRISFLLT